MMVIYNNIGIPTLAIDFDSLLPFDHNSLEIKDMALRYKGFINPSFKGNIIETKFEKS